MGASFRNIGQICELAGCDLLTISPKLLQKLADTEGDLPRKLSPERASEADVKRIDMNHTVFKAMHADDKMATEKLAEGIDKFSAALEDLEANLKQRLAELGD